MYIYMPKRNDTLSVSDLIKDIDSILALIQRSS